MDFHRMKRKQLQALCKKHRIPANLSNLDMANKLTEFIREKENPVIQEVIKEQEAILSETESINVVVNTEVKKVRFSPEHELIEFTRSPEMKRSRRNSVCRKDCNLLVEIARNDEINKATVCRPRGRPKRTGELKLMEAEVNQKKIGMKALNCNGGKTIASDVDIIDEGKSEVRLGRVMRLRGKMAAEGAKNASKREGEEANDDGKIDENASNNVHNKKEIVDNRCRVTRSRAQKLTEAPAEEGKRGRKVAKNIGKAVAVGAETDALSKRGDEGEGKSAMGSDEIMKGNGKDLEGILVNKQIAGEHEMVEPQVLLRRSKRKAYMVGGSEMLTNDTKKHEDGEIKVSRKTSKLLASAVSQVNAEIIGSEVNPGRRAVLEIEEPTKKVEPRRSNRRKTMIESDNLRAENENICPVRSSVPQSDIVPEVPEDEKSVLHPIGVLRRSRRKTLGPKLISSTNGTDSAVENAERLVSELCPIEERSAVQKNTRSRRNTSKCKPPELLVKIGGDSNIQQKNKLMKRKRGHVSGDVIKDNNDINSGAQPMKGSSSKKVVSSHHGFSGIEESLSLDVQLSVSKDPESTSNLCSKNVINDVELRSIRNTVRKKEDVSNADSAGSSCMNLTNGEEVANSDTNAASKNALLETDSTIAEDQNYTSNTGEVEKGDSMLEIERQESIEQNVTDADKNDPEAQVYSQMKDLGCNNKINDQVLAEGLDASEEEGSAEANSSDDSLLLGDQTHVSTDLKVAENEADECLQSIPRVVDHHNDLDHLEASSNILDKYNNNEDTSQTTGEVEAIKSDETDFTHSKSTLQLKAPSSSMTRHLGGDNVAEGNETFFSKCIASELAETDRDGCSKDNRNSINHSSEFDMPDVSSGERDARIVSQDRGTFSSEYSVMNSDKKHEVFQAVAPTAICTNSADVNLKRGHEDDRQMTKREEICIDEGINSEASEIQEGKSSMGNQSKCDGDGEFDLADLFDEEGRYGIMPQAKENFSGEHSVKDFNEQGMLHGSPFVKPTSACNSTGDHEANHSAEGGETYTYDRQSELSEAGKSGCLKSHESSKDGDWELSGFKLFDEEKSTRIKPQDRVVSAKYSMKDLHEVETFPDLPVASTTCVNYTEVRESSISQETNPSIPSRVSETQAEQQKSLLAELKVANANQMQEAWSNASVQAENAVHSFKSYAEGEISQVAEGLIADDDVNHAKYGLDKDGSAGACISDVKGCTISKIAAESLNDIKFQDSVETEQQHLNLLAGRTESDAGEEATHAISRQSWTEIELHNLFGTTSDEDAPVLGDTFCHGTEIANMPTSKTKSTAKNSCSLTKKKGTEMKGENINEGEKSKNKNVVLPTGFSDDDIDENQLKFLFATPVKIITPNKIEESVTSIKECSGTVKENVATESTSNEKAQNAENEVETNLCIGASLSDNGGGDDICEEMNEVESFELLNTSTGILSGAGYDGCEALEDRLKQNNEECLKGTNLITEEDEEHVILLAQSCLHDEATEKNIISSSDTHMLEALSCQSKAHSKSEEMEQSTEAVFELSDADLQKSDVPDNSHLLTVGSDDGNILRAASIATSSDPEVAKIGSFQKDVAEKGISAVLFSNVSPECDLIRVSNDQYERDDKDIYDELHTNRGVAIKKSVSIGYNLSQELDQLPSYDELESTCKEAKGMGTTLGDLLPDIGGDDTCEKINNVESVELKDASTTPLSLTENGGYEASEEQLTENTGDSQKETNFITEDKEEKVIPLGQSHLSDEGTDNNSESTEENIVSLSGLPNNFDKVEGCQDMLIDTSLSESLKSQQEMTQSSEAALELSDVYLQNSSVSKNSRLTACFEDDNIDACFEDNIYKETSLKTSSGLLVAELAITGIFDGQNARDEGTSQHHSLKASSPVDDELTKEKDTVDLNEANVCDEIDAKAKSSQYMSDELHMNSEVAISRSLADSINPCKEEADKLPCSLELESMFLEAKETGTTGQDLNNIVACAEHGSSDCVAASSIENLDAATPVVFNLNGDNEKNSEKAEDKKSAQMVQFSIQEVHFEENVKDDAHIVSNSPASETLKESDVADTIREYIDSESSLSMIFENFTVSHPSDVSIHKDDIVGGLGSSNDEDNMTEIKEHEEATLFMEPAQVSRPGCVAFLAEGTSVEVDSQKKMESADVELSSTTRKNASRTILIHGTPGKLVTMADMKENIETQQKRSNMGDITAVRPAKRRALLDLNWK